MAPNGSGLQMLKWEFREREREFSLLDSFRREVERERVETRKYGSGIL